MARGEKVKPPFSQQRPEAILFLPYKRNLSFEVPVGTRPLSPQRCQAAVGFVSIFPGQTRLPDILLCCSMWQRVFILFTLEGQCVSHSCQVQLWTHQKEGRKPRALSARFSFCPILLHYCFSQGTACLVIQATWMLFRKHNSWGPLQRGACWAVVLGLLEKLIQCNKPT